jgi:hypothetical protein
LFFSSLIFVSSSKSPSKDKQKRNNAERNDLKDKRYQSPNKGSGGSPAHSVSLLQQLENLKNQGTDAFVKAIEGSPVKHARRGSASARGSVFLKRNPRPPSSSVPSSASTTGFSPQSPSIRRKSLLLNTNPPTDESRKG